MPCLYDFSNIWALFIQGGRSLHNALSQCWLWARQMNYKIQSVKTVSQC